MTIRGIAFDLEGTIVDVEAAHHNGHLATACEFGLTLSLEEAYAKVPHFIGGPDDKICEDIKNLLEEETCMRVTVDEILARDTFHYMRLLAEIPIAPRFGFLDFYERVRGMGLKLTIGSLTPEKQAMMLLEQSGLATLFGQHNIVLREHVVNLKPAPDVFLKTASMMDIDPQDQLVFEDSPRGVKAALAAGSEAIGMPVYNLPQIFSELNQAGAKKVFSCWTDPDLLQLIETFL